MIIFEEIKKFHRLAISWCIFCKKEVYFIRVNKNCQNDRWLQAALQEGRIKKAPIDHLLAGFEGVFYDKAFDCILSFFNLFRDNPIISRLKSLYDSQDTDLCFQKILHERLARFFYLNTVIDRFEQMFPEEPITFVPSDGIEVYRTDACEIADYQFFLRLSKRHKINGVCITQAQFPWSMIARSYARKILNKVGLCIKILALPLWVGGKKIAAIFHPRLILKHHYKYAIMVISPRRQFANQVQKIDFIIDDKQIKKDEALFIFSTSFSRNQKRYMHENNVRQYLHDHQLDDIDNLARFMTWSDIKRGFSVYGFLLFSVFQKSFILDVGTRLVYFYLIWNGFLHRVSVGNLITYCDTGIRAIARNIICHKHGCRTYYYMDTANIGFGIAVEDSELRYRHNCFGFLNYNTLISWSDRASRYFCESHCRFNNVQNVGCFWAEHLRLIAQGEIFSELKKHLTARGLKEGMKIVSVYDSTFHDHTITTYEDGISFLKDMLRLADDLKDTFFVFKEKKPRNFHAKVTTRAGEILALYKRMDQHPRFCCVDWNSSTSEINAFSDLVISFPFTSTTFEAITYRKKALWHDAANKLRGTFYDRVPGLVCHSYSELLTRAQKLLHETSGEEYDRYLDYHVKENIESFLDGKAIHRFRILLTEQYKNRCPSESKGDLARSLKN